MLLTRQSAGSTDLMKEKQIYNIMMMVANPVTCPALHRPIPTLSLAPLASEHKIIYLSCYVQILE